jgi:hypothetical protein
MTEFPDIHRPEIGSGSIEWVHLRGLYLRMEAKPNLGNHVFYIKKKTIMQLSPS